MLLYKRNASVSPFATSPETIDKFHSTSVFPDAGVVIAVAVRDDSTPLPATNVPVPVESTCVVVSWLAN